MKEKVRGAREFTKGIAGEISKWYECIGITILKRNKTGRKDLDE